MSALTHTAPAPTGHSAQPVYLLEVSAAAGRRTVARGPLWDGVLALAGCLVRNIGSMADRARVEIASIELNVATARSDEPPAITSLVVDARIASAAPFERVRHVVELALGYGTISRTLARACAVEINLTINGRRASLDVPALLTSPWPEE
jgi:uncharacterized OsmC-like protein